MKPAFSVISLTAAILISATVSGAPGAPRPAQAPAPVEQAEVYPSLEEPVLVMGETDGFRPLHLSIYGRYAAITAAKPGATRIYLYDTLTQELTLIGEDAKTGIQIVWGHLHYKSGQVSINDKYVAYGRENGERDQLILREIADPTSVKIYDLPDGASLGGMSVGNDDTGGFGVIGYKRGPGRILHANVYYLDLADDTFKLIHESTCDQGADPKNSWLYNRGPQTRNGTMTWIFGSHDCAKATIYYWDGSFNADGTAKTKALPLSTYAEENIQSPSMVTMFEDKIYMYAYNIQYLDRSTGVAEWDPVNDTLVMVGDGLTPSLAGKWLLLSNPRGIFKIDTTAADLWESKKLVIPPAPNSNHYTQSGARLSRTGRFVYFRMDNMDGENTRVYMADIGPD